jgi:hypothetical protein
MTPERRQVLELLGEASEIFPEMRMGQWLTMFAASARDATVEAIYDVEDEELIPAIRSFLERHRADAVARAG